MVAYYAWCDISKTLPYRRCSIATPWITSTLITWMLLEARGIGAMTWPAAAPKFIQPASKPRWKLQCKWWRRRSRRGRGNVFSCRAICCWLLVVGCWLFVAWLLVVRCSLFVAWFCSSSGGLSSGTSFPCRVGLFSGSFLGGLGSFKAL